MRGAGEADHDMSQSESVNLRRGVVAVIVRSGRFLVIRRSRRIEAAGAYCFPGGGIEEGESEVDALCREICEELGVRVAPVRRIWRSVTSWRVALDWWSATIENNAAMVPYAPEVESYHWLTAAEMRDLPALLESNRHFLDALDRGEFSLDGV